MKGEVGAFLYNYRRLEGMSLNIKDNELDFEGFEALIKQSQIDKKAKSTMEMLIDILQDKLEQNKIYGIVTDYAATTNKSMAAKNRKLKILLFTNYYHLLQYYSHFVALYYASNPLSPQPCKDSITHVLNQPIIKSMPLEGKKTDGVEIDIPGNRVFVVNRDKSISMIDICHDKPSGTIPINASLIVPEAYHLDHREIGNPRNLFSLITDKNLGVMNWISGDIDFRNWVDGKVYRFKIYYVNGAGNQLYSLIFNPKEY